MARQLKAKEPNYFWKIRDKNTGLFVAKAPPYYKRKDNQYAATSTTGRTYSRLSDAMAMLGYIATQIDSKNSQMFYTWNNKEEQDRKRQWVFETTSPYFEVVCYRVEEVINE